MVDLAKQVEIENFRSVKYSLSGCGFTKVKCKFKGNKFQLISSTFIENPKGNSGEKKTIFKQ